jgi:cell division protein FtsN
LKITLIIALVAALTILILKLVKKRKHKPQKGHSYRFPRSLDVDGKEQKPKNRLKPLLAWMVFVLLLSWVALAIFSPREEDTPQSASASETDNAPTEAKPLSNTISGKFDTNPPIPSEKEMEILAEKEQEARAAHEAALKQAEYDALNPPPEYQAVAEAGLGFAPIPEEMVIIGAPMAQGAREFAPKISRMEPIGRSLDPSVPPPPKKPKIEPGSQPPEKEELHLSVPDPKDAPPMPLSKPLTDRRYTVIVGSFAKEKNAEQLKTQFEDMGLPAEISLVTSNNKIYFRVRSGLFDDYSAAENYCRDLKQKNLVAQPYILVMSKT